MNHSEIVSFLWGVADLIRDTFTELRDTASVPLRGVTPPRPLGEIEADIRTIETDIMRMLSEVTGGAPASEAPQD